jgi:signal peptidase I
MTENAETPAPAKRRSMGWIPRLLIGGGGLGIVMGAALAAVFAPYKVPSGSMWPTVQLGEHILVTRIAKQPFRGVFVVFHYPEHRADLFAKRIIGLAGDEITVTDGKITINGWPVPRCEVGRASFTIAGEKHEGKLAVEFLGTATYLVFDETMGFDAGVQGPYRVAPGEYFVMGDNRNNSHDSRMWRGGAGGGVPSSDTLGRVVGHETIELPKGAEDLAPALAACLAKRPTETDPPAPK